MAPMCFFSDKNIHTRMEKHFRQFLKTQQQNKLLLELKSHTDNSLFACQMTALQTGACFAQGENKRQRCPA